MGLSSPFNTYFEKTYCINIDERTDRWFGTLRRCGLEGFVPERYDAVIEDNRVLAFNKSQLEVIRLAYFQCKGNVLILEDDCVFKNTMHLHYAMNELPEDWEILFLGANIIGSDTLPFTQPVRHSSHLFLLTDCWQTHAVAYSQRGLSHIVNSFKPDNGYIYDEWLRQYVLPRGKSFIIAPQIAYQEAGHSDIWNVHADYTSLFERGNKLLK